MSSESLVVSISEKGALVVKRKIEGIGKGARKAEGSVKLLNRALGGLAAVGVATGIGFAIKQMASFAQEMATVKAITGTLGDEFDALREKAKNLGTNTRFSATQAAEGMTFLARAGFSANEVLESIGPTLQLAQAGALDLGRAADIASNILTGFRIEASDSAHVMDVLALAANSANTNVSQLGEAMKFVAPVSAGLGVSLEETTAAVQALGDAGIQASMAGTSLRMVMRLLEAPTAKQKSVFAELGLEADDLKVSEVGLTAALQKLSDAGIETGQSLRAFGRAGTSFDVLVNAIPKIEKFTKANKAADGTARDIAKTMDENLNGALLAVKSAWEGLVLAFGDLGTESGLTQFFFGLADTLRMLARNLEVATKLFGALGIAIAAIKWSVFLTALSQGNLGVLKLSVGLLKLKGAFAALSLNPLTIGFVALSAAIAATLVYFDKLNKMQDEIEAVEERIYKYRLKRLQDQVKEIQLKKQQTANLEAYIGRLTRENELLAMNTQEREESVNLFKALEIAGRALTKPEEQRITRLLEEKEAIKQRNETLRQEDQLLTELLRPQQEYTQREELLTSLRDKGKISLQLYNDELARMKATLNDSSGGFDEYLAGLERENELLAMGNNEREIARALDAAEVSLGNGLTPGQKAKIEGLIKERQALAEVDDGVTVLKANMLGMEEANTVVSQSLASVWMQASGAIDEFIDSGTMKFRDFAMAVVKDVTKIAAKLAILQAFQGFQGMFNVGGFASGGSFTVGGSGGTDSQPVAFMATPGERVDVLTPAQQSAQVQSQQPQAAVGLTIINLIDPAEVPAIMAGAEGQQVTLNTISLNGSTVRQAIA